MLTKIKQKVENKLGCEVGIEELKKGLEMAGKDIVVNYFLME